MFLVQNNFRKHIEENLYVISVSITAFKTEQILATLPAMFPANSSERVAEWLAFKQQKALKENIQRGNRFLKYIFKDFLKTSSFLKLKVL